MDVLLTAISQGLLWSLLAMGVFLTFRILDIADLTAEGSFPLGAAVASFLIIDGVSPILATGIAILVGMCAGLVTGILYTKLKIPALLSGILSMTALYSINLRIMGRANLSMIGQETIFNTFNEIGISDKWIPIVIGFVLVSCTIFLLFLFFNTELGFVLRATGDNVQMVRAQGSNTDTLKIFGLMISNGLIAFSGALIAQDNGYADISMGIGTIVIGLASVIIGEVLFGNLTIAKRLMCVVLGSTIYRMIIALVLNLGMAPTDLKLISAILLAITLSSPMMKGVLQKSVGKRGFSK